MVDERTARGWVTLRTTRSLALLGVDAVPMHAIVGLLFSPARDADPIEDLVRRDAFQRAVAQLVKRRGNLLSGRIGDHGVIVLVDDASNNARVRAKLTSIAESVARLARHFDLKLCLGVSDPKSRSTLPERFQSALAAAEKALSEGRSLIHSEPYAGPAENPLLELRRRLVRVLSESPRTLLPQFERYIEAASVRSGYRLEPVRIQLEAAFDPICDALRSTGAIGERSLAEVKQKLEQKAQDANTVGELSEIYRAVISDVVRAMFAPQEARQQRSLRRALGYIREHLAEPLTLPGVARVAGFAPGYFSKLFVASEGIAFHAYVRRLRVARARQMLASTTLNVERIAQLAGFRTRSRFYEAFKRETKATPDHFRARNA
ncbi:MAG TPA: AraC family transcriptional regulator, partial [Polyangiaceae bacterium]|jgi:AraC-like DNA-binding protein|nr:AraC family transcriptional regulator [Polyangiaceae bacterium]